ncbi:MAG: hypothetical protein KC912_01540 [Proteobacteria bacterium]|nr:hypothetical protein [Pseudomonadota bacterium]
MAQRDPLIEALARGFSQWEDRARLAKAAGLSDPQLAGDPYDVWDGLVEQAVAEGRTAALAQALTDEGRPRLASAVKEGGLPDSKPRAAVLMAALMGASLFMFLFYVVLDPAQRDVDARMGSSRAVMDAATQPRELPEPEEKAPVEAEDAVDAIEDADEPADPNEAPDADTLTGWGDCKAAPGTRIGYAWAGKQVPSSPWRPEGRVNVRADYPNEANSWNTTSATVCILPSDVEVPLAEGVIEVDGGAVYIPVVAPR